MSPYRLSLLVCVLFCLAIGAGFGFNLRNTYLDTQSKIQGRLLHTSDVVSEWVKGTFLTSDTILRDVVGTFSSSQLLYPHPDPVQHAKDTDILKARVDPFSMVNGLALFSKDCVVTHHWSLSQDPFEIGGDGAEREWCLLPKNNPEIDTFVTNGVISNDGTIAVAQVRRIPHAGDNDDGKVGFYGLGSLSVSVSYFSNGLDKIDVGNTGFVSILDSNFMVLAQKPVTPDRLGTHIASPGLEGFLSSDASYLSKRSMSSVDGVDRFTRYKKMTGLPFVVVVGEGVNEALSAWYIDFAIAISSMILLWLMAIVSLRRHWQRLDGK